MTWWRCRRRRSSAVALLAERARRAVAAYRLRLKRRGLLWRAWRGRRQLRVIVDRSAGMAPGAVLCFATIRNEGQRLPFFLQHHRNLGVGHFLFVDNASDDGSADWLAGQPDVSLWTSAASYRDARFGMDWLNLLLMRHGAGHWCLTLDADEMLIYPNWQNRSLPELTAWLEARGIGMMAAMLLDLYPKGPLSQAQYRAGQDPVQVLPYFDGTGYSREKQERFANTSIRGGVRKRVFFADRPDHAPHLHKTPLIRWNRRFAYVSSTHVALPPPLNLGFETAEAPTGVLLHSKFLQGILGKSQDEKLRREHFTHAERYDSYYDTILTDPDLWHGGSCRYQGWEQLVALGLMAQGEFL